MGVTLTDKQMDILQHSLGLNYKDEPYRNHYATADDDAELSQLVEIGVMDRGPQYPGGLRCFYVTEEGKAIAITHKAEQIRKRPRLTPGQRRYRRWLEISDCYNCYTFKDFLTHPGFAEERRLI